MTLQTSGAISLTDIQTEFGGPTPILMSNYYAGGAYVPTGTLNGSGVAIPSSVPKSAAPVAKSVVKSVAKPVVPKPYKPVTGLAVETALHNFAVKLGITGIELAAFMGQSAHESDGFKTVKEYASGAAYEGRRDLGNTQPGDGVKYKGRGFIQITGRDNYTAAGKALNLDLVNRPELAETPANAAKVTWWYWKSRVRPAIGNFSNTLAVTKKVNGGTNGLKAREKYTQSFRQAQK